MVGLAADGFFNPTPLPEPGPAGARDALFRVASSFGAVLKERGDPEFRQETAGRAAMMRNEVASPVQTALKGG